MGVHNSASASTTYSYDALGRMTYDGLSDLDMEYNYLDLPRKVISGGTALVNYSYLADGTKTSSLKEDGSGLVYRGPFVYRKNADGTMELESAVCPEGRLTPGKALLYVTDHLGSVRYVIDGNTGAQLENSDYTAYGTRSGSSLQPGTGLTFRDHFTGQEDQMPDFNIPYNDHGARHYNPALLRWMVPDPLSEKYYGQSPYNYCGGNPMNFVDLDGRELKPLGEEELEVIRNTLPKGARQYVQLNERGAINKELLSQCTIESCNIEALKALVNSGIMYEYRIDATYQGNLFYDNGDGNYCYGVTMMPGAKIDPSPDDNVYVISADFLKGEKKASNAAHELFGHAYFYELRSQGKDVNPNHTYGNTGETQVEYVEGLGNLDVAIFGRTNTLLENQIKKVENEAIINFRLK